MKFIMRMGGVILLSMFSLLAIAQKEVTTDRFVIMKGADVVPGGAVVYFDVGLEGSRLYTAYNLEIALPEGFTFAKNTAGSYYMSMRKPSIYPYIDTVEEGNQVPVKTYTHSIFFALQSNGNMRLACLSLKNEEFTDVNGALFRVYVQASPYTKPGDAEVRLTGLLLAAKDEKGYIPESDLNAGNLTVTNQAIVPIQITAERKFGTCILPFAMDALPDGLAAYTAGEVENGVLSLSLVNKLDAFTPYILYAKEGFDGELTGTVDPDTYPAESSVTIGVLTGLLVDQEVTSGYLLQDQGSGMQFYAVRETPALLPAGQCYLSIPESIPALTLNLKSPPADITTVECDAQYPETFYDLQGRSVCQPLPGSIYVSGNRKIFITR